MMDGWRWRHARNAELAAMVATVIGNRTGFATEPVVFADLMKNFTDG